MSNSRKLTDGQVAEMIQKLIERGEIDELLYDLLCGLGYQLLQKRSEKDGLLEEAQSLAVEFIFHLRDKRKSNIQSAGHLSHELSKYLTQRDNPVSHEIWKFLSQALNELAKEGLAVRASDGANKQTVVWCLKDHTGKPSAKPEEFFRLAAHLPVYYPKRKDGRLLSPSQAKELALKMLDLAGGPILMQDLHVEAVKHVIPPLQFAQPIDESPSSGEEEGAPSHELADRIPVHNLWFEEEASVRADKVWGQLNESGDGEVLCIYFIPKHLLGRSVKQSELGSEQRVSEAVQRIREIFRDILELSPLLEERRDTANGVAQEFISNLLGRIMEILIDFCAEKSWDRNLGSK